MIGVRPDRSTDIKAAGQDERSDPANGWRLAGRQATCAGRVGIEEPAGGDLAALNRMGCILGVVSWRSGVLVPEYIGPGRILERWPPVATHSA